MILKSSLFARISTVFSIKAPIPACTFPLYVIIICSPASSGIASVLCFPHQYASYVFPSESVTVILSALLLKLLSSSSIPSTFLLIN